MFKSSWSRKFFISRDNEIRRHPFNALHAFKKQRKERGKCSGYIPFLALFQSTERILTGWGFFSSTLSTCEPLLLNVMRCSLTFSMFHLSLEGLSYLLSISWLHLSTDKQEYYCFGNIKIEASDFSEVLMAWKKMGPSIFWKPLLIVMGPESRKLVTSCLSLSLSLYIYIYKSAEP